ncbi:hypothetical protein, partial [Flavobacterium sp.]|uniref:hypothetical protein n=1 Tax=Flavobacterium sp. TaxID=239 RepID=UPI0025D3E65A
MRFKIFLFCLFFYLNANSQTSPLPNNETRKSGLSKEEFTYACNEYKKMILTDEYLKSEEKIRAFNEKIQDFVISHNIPFDSLKNKDVSLKLIKNNLTQTKFKSVAEAELYIDEMESSTEKLEKK